MIVDYLGTEIKVAQKAIRCSNYGSGFTGTEIAALKAGGGACVGIRSSPTAKVGWTYPYRLIVQDSLINPL